MASGPWDNVSLPSPPNNPAYLQAWSQLANTGSDLVNNAFNAYQQGQNFQNQQQLFPYQLQQAQRQQNLANLFQNGVPTLPNGQVDYNSVFKSMLQAGGAPEVGTAISALPAFQKQQLIDSYIGNGGQQPTNPTAPAAGSPNQIDPQWKPAGNYYRNGPKDEEEGISLNYLAAQSHTDLDKFLAANPQYRRWLDRDNLSDNEAKAIQTRMRQFREGETSGAGTSNRVPQSGTDDQETRPTRAAASNQLNPSMGEGSSPISPRQTGERRIAEPKPAQNVVAQGSAAAMVPPQFRDNPQAFADYLRERATQLRQNAKGKIGDLLGVSSKRDEDEAKALDDRAKSIEEALGKDVTAKRTPQLEADTKYYDSLHRGLTGTAMIAAQQKQNIDMLRQVAASPNFTPGAGSDLALAYQRVAAQLGINPTGAAPREIFNQVATRILADQISGLKSMASETGETGARVFKQMIDLEEKANLTHENSLEGIKSQLDIIDRVGDLMMKWANKADDYKIQHGQLDAGFDKSLRADIAKARLPNIVPQKAQPAAPAKTQPGGWQEIAPGIRIREKPSAANST